MMSNVQIGSSYMQYAHVKLRVGAINFSTLILANMFEKSAILDGQIFELLGGQDLVRKR